MYQKALSSDVSMSGKPILSLNQFMRRGQVSVSWWPVTWALNFTPGPCSVSLLLAHSPKAARGRETGNWRAGEIRFQVRRQPPLREGKLMEYSISRNSATPFFAIITQRDHKYATLSPWKQFYVFLATAPIDVLTAGTAEIRRTSERGERCCTFMEKRRRCTIYCTFFLQKKSNFFL